MFFDKKNGMHLFTLFIILGAITFMATSYIFVRNQAIETARIINDENLKGKFSAIEQYVSEFFESHERTIHKISAYPYVVSAILEGGEDIAAMKDQMSLIKTNEVGTFVNLYDFTGESIYIELELSAAVNQFIVQGIKNESIINDPGYIFFKDGEQDYLLITEPIKYNQSAEGLSAYIITLNGNNLIGRLTADSNHWFGISQDRFNWSMSPKSGWKVQSKKISKFDITLLYASSPTFLAKTESDFLTSLLMRMAFATLFTIILLYFIGRRLLVSPFQSLAESEHLLELQAEELKIKGAESTRLARVAKYMRDAVLFTDVELNIIWVNSAFEAMTGFKKEEVAGFKASQFLQGPETDPKTVEKIRTIIGNREFGTFEIVTYGKNRAPYWLEVQVSPLFNEQGDLEGFMAVKRDISSRKALEETLKQSAKKAEAANVAKSQFLASMSHELRTPMNGVLGMSELIKDSTLTPEQHEMVNTLLSSGKHMLSVLNDILDFSKIEAGKLNLNFSSFSLCELEAEVSQIYQALCDEKGLTFNLTFAEDERYVCVADKVRIQQILQNLLNNAWKFTQQGQISASIKVVKKGEAAQIELVVSDTGIGIKKEKQSIIFQPFSQAENDTTRRFGGTGLGLSIVSELINAMQGTIELESTLGVGSQFTVIIPIKLGERLKDIKRNMSSIFDGAGLKALIVEDNKINITVLTMFLKKRGITCEVAENGQEGVEKIKNYPFDLVMMDNHMPVMDGIEATKIIKALRLDREPLIIGCTADAFEQTRIDMLNAGCKDVVTKPIHTSRLDEVLISNFNAC
ncbi:hypothetical protein GCM10007916_27960 [Psychromonas marina]|uniref:histidine kinase n=1 Tax=Psychromonas marina TaxID=88364 RepID=A0ABQ6E3Z7_9GAMM|nr:ATP-binding protein [Psychromonas marina]GLS91726.1 hypothetical protein GCM10007916_27960 [Psychromonas marina]